MERNIFKLADFSPFIEQSPPTTPDPLHPALAPPHLHTFSILVQPLSAFFSPHHSTIFSQFFHITFLFVASNFMSKSDLGCKLFCISFVT